jgi:hypothetical protein
VTGKQSLFRKVLCLIAVFTCLTLVAVLVLAKRVSAESGCGVSAERLLPPFKVCSSFTSRRAMPPAEVAEILKLPLFPQANGIEKSLRQSPDGVLVVLELHSSSRLGDVERWYAHELGASYQKRAGPCAALSSADQVWTQRVLEDCAGTGVLFLANVPGRSRGVLLSPQGDESVMRLFLQLPAKPGDLARR